MQPNPWIHPLPPRKSQRIRKPEPPAAARQLPERLNRLERSKASRAIRAAEASLPAIQTDDLPY